MHTSSVMVWALALSHFIFFIALNFNRFKCVWVSNLIHVNFGYVWLSKLSETKLLSENCERMPGLINLPLANKTAIFHLKQPRITNGCSCFSSCFIFLAIFLFSFALYKKATKKEKKNKNYNKNNEETMRGVYGSLKQLYCLHVKTICF